MADGTKARRPRREFNDDFKASAVRLVIEGGKTVKGTARELDLNTSTLQLWVTQARANQSNGKTGLTSDERAELTRLRKENRELKMTQEILKKAAVRSTGRCNTTLPGSWLKDLVRHADREERALSS